MIPDEQLVELFDIATQPWGGLQTLEAPTRESLQMIATIIGVSIPPLYAHLATICPSYGAWLAGVGPDLTDPSHIVALNKTFHTESSHPQDAQDYWPPIPAHLVILNQGYDGDCDCWDTTAAINGGEFPIVYLAVRDDSLTIADRIYPDFRSYIESYAIRSSCRSPHKLQRRRAKRIVKELKAKAYNKEA